ncbi:MAPEG family protein [Pseudidiomarina insulisalsae]|uniref:Glutathione S-transferase n=1 Tax=Pseudidiomarina insulisalsae TaxID=575789 RepID=A0A432YEY2_9GAMM|nr:MAPEG family protein [Pseudidiomarina insulisalsae]RUO59513.1 glutathione S-transferase [Pseudidiomarina insulisalsae]
MAVELQISMIYAGLLALLYFALSVAVIRLRWRDRVGIGTGQSKDLEVATRIHANFAEYVPLLLLLLVLMELSGASATLLHGLGGLLFIARICHALGLRMSIGPSWARTVGVLGTFIVLLVEAGYMLGYAVGLGL